MRRNFLYTCIAISLAIISILGFTSTDPIQRNPNVLDNAIPGPATDSDLDNPLSALNESSAADQISGPNAITGCNYSWESQTSGTTSQLLTISAVSDLIGWAAGAAGTVRRTTNGGITWGNGNSNPGVINGDIANIYAWSANDAICTTTPGATNIYKTSNGGTNWTLSYTNAMTGAFINALKMISATEGYATGDPIANVWVLLKTTNGGTSWSQMPSAPAGTGEAGYNNSFQILGNNMWWGTTVTKIYHSTNLGLNWTTGATIGTANTFALHYNNASTGMAGGTIMVLSTNGGSTYTGVTAPGNPPGALNGIEGDGNNNWWAIRSGPSVYRSTDAGATWTTPFTVTGAEFQHIDFVVIDGCPQGWVVGNAGAIAKIDDMVGISNVGTGVPEDYLLKQNFPNPFNPATNINFSIPKTGLVTLKIYNVSGKEVAILVNEVMSAGSYIVDFNAAYLPSGVYFYRIESNNFVDTKKMILIR